MNKVAVILLASVILLPVAADGQDSLATTRLAAYESLSSGVGLLSYGNPALVYFRHEHSLSDVTVAYGYMRQTEALYEQCGNGTDGISISADSYIRRGSSVISGNASYSNGKRRGVRWCEASDYEIVYPYVTADDAGGDMSTECYRFGGCYASLSDRCAWGASASYDAGHAYRAVDPRPRNVSGIFDLSAGAAYRLWGKYYAGAMVSYRKYKQTSELEFKSELGETAVYHTTGLGTVYKRFTGLGKDTYYSGSRYGLGFDIYGRGDGAYLSVRYMDFGFDYVLTDLNKLPMSSVSDRELRLQTGWRFIGESSFNALELGWEVKRRLGTENIFGDAATGQYPLILSMTMYADNHSKASATYVGQWHRGRLMAGVRSEIAYDHRRTVYVYPRREKLKDRCLADVDCKLSRLSERGRYFSAKVNFRREAPMTSAGGGLTVGLPVVGHYALAMEVSYQRGWYHSSHMYEACCSLQIVF